MLQVVNHTPFVAELMLFANEQGVDSAYSVIKATYSIHPRLTVAKEQVPIVPVDKPSGEPGKSSVHYPADACLIKPATDVLLVGHAWAPRAEPVPDLDVTLRVGALAKTVRVFGDRIWKRGMLSPSPSAPEPFTCVPLTYERAFGGTDTSRAAAGTVEADPRNPFGVGFRGRRTTLSAEGGRLPNLEDPKDLISSPKDRPAPACFGPIPGNWEPRRSFAGTYDEAWQKNRAPYLPADFDRRFFQTAPPGLVAPGYLAGGEPVTVENVSPRGTLQFTLPQVRLRVVYTIAGVEQERVPNLDTVLIEPDHNRLILVWRAVAECDKQGLKVRQIEVDWDQARPGGPEK
jgi:hypothetical protein